MFDTATCTAVLDRWVGRQDNAVLHPGAFHNLAHSADTTIDSNNSHDGGPASTPTTPG